MTKFDISQFLRFMIGISCLLDETGGRMAQEVKTALRYGGWGRSGYQGSGMAPA